MAERIRSTRRAIWLDAAERELLRRALAHVAAEVRPETGEAGYAAASIMAKQWTRDGLHALLAKVQEPGAREVSE